VLNAPTGSGKTYALFLPILLEGLHNMASDPKAGKGLQAIWITPIKALMKDIRAAGQQAIDDLGMDWTVEIRSGDTSSSVRARQRRKPPQILITTPGKFTSAFSFKGI
jgi:ATP-dependent Lhr-like helicase